MEDVGPEIWGPSSLCIKGPKPRPRSPTAEEPYCQGRAMKAPWRPKDVAKDDFTSNISQKRLKKGTDLVQEQHKGSLPAP